MESYVERAPVPELAGVVRTVWMQRTGSEAYVQRHLPTGGVELHFPIGGPPRLLGPLTGPLVEVIAPHTTVVGVRFRPGDAAAAPGRYSTTWWTRSCAWTSCGDAPVDRLVEQMARAADGRNAPQMILQAHLLREVRTAERMDRLVEVAVQALMPWSAGRRRSRGDPSRSVEQPVAPSVPAGGRCEPQGPAAHVAIPGLPRARASRCHPHGSTRNGRHGRVGGRRGVRRPGSSGPRVPAPDRTHPAPVARRRRRSVRLRPRALRVLPPLPGYPGQATAALSERAIRSIVLVAPLITSGDNVGTGRVRHFLRRGGVHP